MSIVFDDRLCELGEGPLWHPLRKQLFWFDILGKRLLSRKNDEAMEWHFEECVSAAGWIDMGTLLVASETGLWRFDIQSGRCELVSPLEADNPATRSNDGRADPWGGFWIGTMGKNAERGAGAIYRYFKGELRVICDNMSISNAICFGPDAKNAYYTDTMTQKVMFQRLDPHDGWPTGKAEVFLDFQEDGLNPDGAVVDAEGVFWVAQWGASRVAAYSQDGKFIKAVNVAGTHSSCPAFGGEDLTTLYCTSARTGLTQAALEEAPQNGMTFGIADVAQGQAEHQVVL